jgi:hypothetical protein
MTLQMYIGGEWQAVSGLELLSLSQTLASQVAGTLSWTEEVADMSTEFRWVVGQSIGLRGREDDSCGWVYLFWGKLAAAPERSFDDGKTVDTYTAEDLLGQLSRIVYQTTEFVAEGFNRSHLILYRDSDGTSLTTGEQLKLVLDYAISVGADLTYEESDLDALGNQPSADEQSDLTCLEILQDCLSWQGNSYTSWEVQDGAAKLRILGVADEITQSADVSTLLKLTCQEGSDKTVRGVVINYEFEDDVVDGTTSQIQTDSAGETEGENVLVTTHSLDDDVTTVLDASITLSCTALPSDYEDNYDFVSGYFPQICSITDCEVTGTPLAYVVDSGYVAGYGVTVSSVTFKWKCKIIKTVSGTTVGDPMSIDYYHDGRNLCTVYPAAYYDSEWVWLQTTIQMTDSPSGTYDVVSSTTVTDIGELVPAGVAASVYNSYRWPLHSGSFTRVLPSALSNWATPQHNVNLTGGPVQWQSMRAPVQTVERDYFDDKEEVVFGYPDQAGVSDFVDLLRAGRSTNRPTRRTWRSED